MERLWRKLETARTMVPKPVVDKSPGASIGLICAGSVDLALQEARQNLARDGIRTDALRVRAMPFTQELAEFVEEHERVYVVEMNTDGQLRQLLQLEVPAYAARIGSIRKNDGLPLTADWIERAFRAEEGG
jgi:2-oxoglutarate ferredoxin oxidoreductase subunit alpha